MDIAVWGEGRALENFMFELKSDFPNTVVQYVASKENYYFLRGYKRKTEEEFLVKRDFLLNIKIVVAVSDKKYPEKKRQLEALGYKEFDDFIGYRMYGKKICVINANCYLFFIKRYLNENSEFRKYYGIYPTPPIHDNPDHAVGDNVLRHADLYIHQDIRNENTYGYKLSDEYTLSKISRGCKTVCIPNFVHMLGGFYPTVTGKNYTNVNGETMCLDDWLINEAYDIYGNNVDNIMYYIASYQFDEADIRKRFDEMVAKWRQREQNWDIKIVDFILNNYRNHYLFEDTTHPADYLQTEICRRLLAHLGISDINKDITYHMGCAMEIFMWPQIKNILGINWRKDKVRIYTKDYCYHDGRPITMKEYIQEYIWRVFET